jgi:hypothetical protein
VEARDLDRVLDRLGETLQRIAEMTAVVDSKVDALHERRDTAGLLIQEVRTAVAVLSTAVAVLSAKLDEARSDIRDNTGSHRLEAVPQPVPDDPTSAITSRGVRVSWSTILRWALRILPAAATGGIVHLIEWWSRHAH